MSDESTGDTFKRREVAPGVYRCGCRWQRRPGWGDVLVQCPIHQAACDASVAKYEREQQPK